MPREGTCTGTRQDGSRCTSTIVLDSGRCFAHDENRRADRAAASAKGGKGKATAARLQRLVPNDLRPSLALLLQALEEVHSGMLDPRAAGAMAALAGAVARLYQTGELEQRLRDLEAAAPQTPGRWRA